MARRVIAAMDARVAHAASSLIGAEPDVPMGLSDRQPLALIPVVAPFLQTSTHPPGRRPHPESASNTIRPLTGCIQRQDRCRAGDGLFQNAIVVPFIRNPATWCQASPTVEAGLLQQFVDATVGAFGHAARLRAAATRRCSASMGEAPALTCSQGRGPCIPIFLYPTGTDGLARKGEVRRPPTGG